MRNVGRSAVEGIALSDRHDGMDRVTLALGRLEDLAAWKLAEMLIDEAMHHAAPRDGVRIRDIDRAPILVRIGKLARRCQDASTASPLVQTFGTVWTHIGQFKALHVGKAERLVLQSAHGVVVIDVGEVVRLLVPWPTTVIPWKIAADGESNKGPKDEEEADRHEKMETVFKHKPF